MSRPDSSEGIYRRLLDEAQAQAQQNERDIELVKISVEKSLASNGLLPWADKHAGLPSRKR